MHKSWNQEKVKDHSLTTIIYYNFKSASQYCQARKQKKIFKRCKFIFTSYIDIIYIK